jgi:phospholipase/lecithinase/hemolysin
MTTYSIIYAFGDSLSDAGNVWALTNTPAAAVLGLTVEPVSPPYFQEIYNNVTADVFSNGPVWTQDLATALGVGTLAPSGVGAFANTVQAALTVQVGPIQAAEDVAALEFETGVSGTNPYIPLAAGVSGGTDFAVGGAVTGPTGENGALSALDGLAAQLVTFQRDVPSPAANALATVSIGGNDVMNILEDANFATLYGTGTTFATVGATAAGQDIAQSVSIEANFLASLIGLGVTNVVVMNVPDMGQVPEAMELGGGEPEAGTVLSQYYNSLLSTDIASLNAGGAHVVTDDAFSLIDNVIANKGSYGITDVTDPVYSGDASSFDPIDLVSTVTAVQNTYLFFDDEHPTETGQTGLAQLAEMALASCFATGTRIRTTDGDVAVEALRIGALAVLADGRTAPVVWIGHREVNFANEPEPRAGWPVRVRADAFGPGMPVRDLYLSPDHAVFVDGVLIPVKYLLDGRAIASVPSDNVTWWHVELPRHAVLLAEGLPCESFLDTGARDGVKRARRADYVSVVWETEACAELVSAGSRRRGHGSRRRTVVSCRVEAPPSLSWRGAARHGNLLPMTHGRGNSGVPT